VEVQEVRWGWGPWHRTSWKIYIFLWKGGRESQLGTGSFVHKGIVRVSAVMRVKFVSDRMSYIILEGRWCHIIVLNVHALTEDKIYDVNDSFYEELELVFDNFPKYHTSILL
jgi:hypothetical protein